MNHLPGETERCHYDYDPLDRQSASTHIAQLTRQRFHCKNRLATELQGTTRRSIFQFDDQLLAQQNYLAANVTATLLAIDHSRSVLNALDAAKIHSLAYSPYGHRPAQSGLLSLLGFNGEQPDPMTGHYHLGNGYRQFNPVLMRFNSPDSWSPFGQGGLNAYGYCKGDPINFVDPTGHVLDGVLKGIRKLVRWVAKPVPRNDPALNSLEGINSDVFNEIAKFLGQKDMDNLALVSKRLNEYSVEASKSNSRFIILSMITG